jgi:hypothetical protein
MPVEVRFSYLSRVQGVIDPPDDRGPTFAVPVRHDPWWRRNEPWRVAFVDGSKIPTEVLLTPDRERREALLDPITSQGCSLQVAENADTGTWDADVVDADGQVRGRAISTETGDVAVRTAIQEAGLIPA